MENVLDNASGQISPVFTWGGIPWQAVQIWLQSMTMLRDAEEEVINEVGTLLDTPGEADKQKKQKKQQPDLAAMPVAFWVNESLKWAKASNAVLDTQLRCLRDMEAGFTQWMALPAVQESHLSADSAGMVLVPPDTWTPASLIQTTSGACYATALAWLNAIQHDLAVPNQAEPGPVLQDQH